MADKTFQAILSPGRSGDKLKAYQGGVLINTGGSSLSVVGSQAALYTSTVTQDASGTIHCEIEDSGGTVIGAGMAYNVLNSGGTYVVQDPAMAAQPGDAMIVSDKTGFSLTSDYDAAKTAASQADVDTLLSDTLNIISMLSSISAGVTSVLNRLGAWAGSGANTLLGAFRALLRSDAPDPSDIGGTYAASTASNQALAVAIDEIEGGGGGSGATPAEIWTHPERALTGVSAGITVIGPVLSSKLIRLVRGDDYNADLGNALLFTLTGYPPLDEDSEIVFSLKDNVLGTVVIDKTAGEVIDATHIRIELSHDQTEPLVPRDESGHTFDIQVTIDGDVFTPTKGKCLVEEDISRPAE